MGGVEPPSCGADQERLQVYRREVVVGTRWQRRKRRFRIRKNVPSTVPARWKASSGWRRKIRMLRSSIIRFPRSATYAARAKLSLFSAVISFARSEDRQPHLQPKLRHSSRIRCTPKWYSLQKSIGTPCRARIKRYTHKIPRTAPDVKLPYSQPLSTTRESAAKKNTPCCREACIKTRSAQGAPDGRPHCS